MSQSEALVPGDPATPALETSLAPVRVREVGLVGSPTSTPLAASPYSRIVKRAIDILGASIALVVTLPLMLIVAAAIMVDSPGKPWFVHPRVGREGRRFGVCKFRTMVNGVDRPKTGVDSDDTLAREWDDTWKLREDPRVTRIGRFLRKYSLDELPQLINVVLGQMSLVGPRPVVDEEISKFGDAAPTVLTVRPGITGLWSVSGRNDVSYEDRVILEERYVREWTLRRDIAILLKTIPCVVSGRGAY